MNAVATQEGNVDVLATLLGATPYSTAKVGLFTNAISPVVTNKQADLTQPIFTSYATVNAVFAGAAIVNADGSVEYVGALCRFQGTVHDDFPVSIQGAFCTEAAGTKLLSAETFDAPLVLHSETEALLLVPRLRFEPTGEVKVSFDLVP